MAAETLRYEAERVANDSTYWLMRFELIWREYFRLYLLKHGTRLFRRGGPQDRDLGWANPAGHFDAWCAGETGEPFVDANMIELKETGHEQPGRQNVASFLTKNLDVDWRLGMRWFESNLMDYCPGANWGTRGPTPPAMGADPRGFRGFAVLKQARNYDPSQTFTNLWNQGSPQHDPLVDPRRSLQAAEQRWDRSDCSPTHPR